jgi:hypothetical protein
MKITLNGYQESSLDDFLPDGDYTVEIVDASLERASTGKEFLKVVFRILEGPFKDRATTADYYLTQKALWKLRSLLNAIDVKVSDASELETAEMLDRTLRIHVHKNEDVNGYSAKSEVTKTMRLDGFKVTDRDLPFPELS